MAYQLELDVHCPLVLKKHHNLNIQDEGKRDFAEELINYIDSFRGSVVSSFKGDGNEAGKIVAVASSFSILLFLHGSQKLNHSNGILFFFIRCGI